MRKWVLLSVLVVLCTAKPAYRWITDCSHWHPMDPIDYWFTVRSDCCWKIVETRGEYACLVLQLEEGQQFYRVDRKIMTREVQEESYRTVAQRFNDHLRESLARANDPDPRKQNYAQQGISLSVRTLEDLTGQHFAEPGEWLRWWQDNHQWLRLAPDGRRLVVDPERR